MWINIKTEEIIKSPKQISVDGITYPPQVFKDKELLKSLGIKPYREVKIDEKYYWQGQLTRVDNGDEVIGTYEAIPRDIGQLQDKLLSKVSQEFKSITSQRPVVDTGLGFYVDGGKDDLTNFEVGKKYVLPEVKDYKGETHPITVEEYDNVIQAIEMNGLNLFQEKWAKEQDIKALDSIEAIIAYENTPFIETRKVFTLDENGAKTYTGDTEEVEVTKDMCTYFSTILNLDEDIVSIRKA